MLFTQRNNCKNIAVIPQYKDICWFTSLLTCLIYSDRMFDIIYKLSFDWTFSKQKSAKSILFAMLVKEIKYKNTAAYKHFFQEFSAEKLLKRLHKEDPDKFSILECDICNQDGTNKCSDILCAAGDPNCYVDNLLEYMGICNFICLQALQNEQNDDMFDVYIENNEKYKSMFATNENPQIIVLFVGSREFFVNHFKNPSETETKKRSSIYRSNSKKRVFCDFTLDETIQYNNNTYVLDSIHLDNYNQESEYIEDNKSYHVSCHAISYITCNNKLFVYNGWITENGKNKPCPLRKMDWLDLKKHPYSFDHKTCTITHYKKDYNKNEELIEDISKYRNKFTKDDRRIYFYVLKELPRKYNYEWGSLVCFKDSINIFTKNDNDKYKKKNDDPILIQGRTKLYIDKQIDIKIKARFVQQNFIQIRRDIRKKLNIHRKNLWSANINPNPNLNSSNSNSSKNSANSDSYSCLIP
jgi:hypothetical protein